MPIANLSAHIFIAMSLNLITCLFKDTMFSEGCLQHKPHAFVTSESEVGAPNMLKNAGLVS